MKLNKLHPAEAVRAWDVVVVHYQDLGDMMFTIPIKKALKIIPEAYYQNVFQLTNATAKAMRDRDNLEITENDIDFIEEIAAPLDALIYLIKESKSYNELYRLAVAQGVIKTGKEPPVKVSPHLLRGPR